MKTLLTTALATTILSFGTALFGQTVVEPTYNAAQFVEIQDITGGNNIGSNIREMTVPVQTGETWIPLGRFSYATMHTLVIDSSGPSGNSTAITEFSTAWGGNDLIVHRLQKQNVQNRFKLYSLKDHPGRMVFLKYICGGTGVTNTVKITYSSSASNKWTAWSDLPEEATFDFTTLTDAHEFKPVFETQSGGLYEGFKRGVFVNGNPIMTRASGSGSSASPSGFSGGANSIASGNYSIAYGSSAKAYGYGSTAFGYLSTAGDSSVGANDFKYATAFGRGTEATGTASTAMGYESKSLGTYSTATGFRSEAHGESSFTSGHYTKVFGDYSFAGGYAAEAHNRMSFAFGHNAYAKGGEFAGQPDYVYNSGAFAFGRYASAIGHSSFAAGTSAKAEAPAAIAMGWAPQATANSANSYW